MFMKQSRTDKSLYNKPSYETFVKTQGSVVAKLKKTGFTNISITSPTGKLLQSKQKNTF